MTLILPCKPHWNPYIPVFSEQFVGPRISCSQYIMIVCECEWETKTCSSNEGCTVLQPAIGYITSFL